MYHRRHLLYAFVAGALLTLGIHSMFTVPTVCPVPSSHIEMTGHPVKKHPGSAETASNAVSEEKRRPGAEMADLLRAMPLNMVMPTGKVSPPIEQAFRLTEHEKQAIETASLETVEAIKKLERENAVLASQNNSEARIVINNFSRLAVPVRTRYLAALKTVLGKDRFEQWTTAPEQTDRSVFSDFGNFEYKEILLSHGKDGKFKINVTVKPSVPGPLYGEVMTVDEIPERLTHVLQWEDMPAN